MATPKSTYKQEGDTLDYTPAAAVSAGAIVQQDGLAGQVVTDLSANIQGALRVKGIVNVKKDAAAITDGSQVGWDNDGTDVDGNTGGALTSTVASMDFAVGIALEAAGTADTDCEVLLNRLPLIKSVVITDSTGGTAASSLAAVGASYSQTVVANNFATLYKVLDDAGIIV